MDEWTEEVKAIVASICDNCGCEDFWYFDDNNNVCTIAECKECGRKQYLQ